MKHIRIIAIATAIATFAGCAEPAAQDSDILLREDWSKYRWWRTQMQSYADFSALDNLAPAEVAISDLKLLIQSREQHIPHRFRMERC